jgi:hypothetical protein
VNVEQMTVGNDGFVRVGVLAQRWGIARTTVHGRLKRAGIVSFIDPTDERARLIRRQNAENLLQPRPAVGRQPVEATHATQTVRQAAA